MSGRWAADVTIVSYPKYPDLAPDDRIFRNALIALGVSVRTCVWSDASVDWSASPVTVIRAAWDYPQHVAAFQTWISHVETRTSLINDAATVRWNMNKRYLAELERRGIAIVPTVFVDAARAVDVAKECERNDWSDVVIKPCIGGSSYGAARFRGAEIAGLGVAHTINLTHGGEAMVQPYVREVDAAGERSYIFIDGDCTHAVRKVPFNSSTVTTGEERIEPVEEERSFARRALSALSERTSYARVDVVPTQRGPLLMELELIEPTLYFELEPRAADALARCVVALRRTLA